jgi:hypothetical protein
MFVFFVFRDHGVGQGQQNISKVMGMESAEIALLSFLYSDWEAWAWRNSTIDGHHIKD